MGNVYSENIVNDAISEFNTQVDSVVQTCTTPLTQNQVTNITGNTGPVTISELNYKQFATIKTNCIGNATTNQSIKANISTQVDQIAKAINQSLSLNPGSTEASNITELTTQLSNEVYNSYLQTCSQVINQSQVTNITDNTGSVTLGVINYDQTVNLLNQCTQNVSSTSDIQTQITQQISQKATAEMESFLAQLAIILLMIVILVGFLEFGSIWKFIIVLIIMIVLYFLLAWLFSWPPFHKPNINTIIDVTITNLNGNAGVPDPNPDYKSFTDFLRSGGLKIVVTPQNITGFAKMTLFDNSTPIGESSNNPNTFTLNPSDLTPGKHNYYVQVTDNKNQTFNSLIKPIMILSDATITIQQPTANGTYSGTSSPDTKPSACTVNAPNAVVNVIGTIVSNLTPASTSNWGQVQINVTKQQLVDGCYPLANNSSKVDYNIFTSTGIKLTSGNNLGYLYAGNYTIQATLFDTSGAILAISTPVNFQICTGTCV